MRVRSVGFLALLLIAPCINQASSAQQLETLPQAGLTTFTPYQHSDIDSVNLSTGNVNVHIPLVGFPQAGDKLKLDFFIRYNEPQWVVQVDDIDTRAATGTGVVYSGEWKLGNLDITQLRPLGADVVRSQGITLTQSQTDIPCIHGNHLAASCSDSYDSPTWVDDSGTYIINYNIRDRSGAEHPVGVYFSQPRTDAENSAGNDFPAISPDGSGWSAQPFFSGGAWGVNAIDSGGVIYTQLSSSSRYYNLSDSHGNTITTSSSGWYDSIGRTIPGSSTGPGSGILSPSSTDPGPVEGDPIPGTQDSSTVGCPAGTSESRTWVVPRDDSSDTATYRLCFSDLTATSNFAVTADGYGNSFAPSEATVTGRVLTSVILPNGTSYTFTYDYNNSSNGNHSYLELTRIDFPTGGYVSYTWQTVTWDVCSYSTPKKRVVASRTLYDGTNSATWNYVWFPDGSCGAAAFSPPAMQVVVRKPDGNDEYHSSDVSEDITTELSGDIGNTVASSGSSTAVSTALAALTQTKKIVSTKEILYSPFYQVIPPAPDGLVDGGVNPAVTYQETYPGPVTSTVTTLDDGSVSETDYTPIASGSIYYEDPGRNLTWGGALSDSTCSCLNYPGITEEKVYDYGSGSHGALLRDTITTFRFDDGMTGASNYLAANLLEIPSSTTVNDGSGTAYAKTTYTYDESGYESASGVTAGDLTTLSRWKAGTTWISTHTAYNSAGVVSEKLDALGVETLITSFGCSNSVPAGVTFAYGTSIAETESYTHDCTSGHITGYTDPNGRSSSFTYSDTLRTC